MRNLRIRKNLMRIGKGKVVQDSIRRGLNHQDLRTMGMVLR
jgi:hypothetical protein